MASKFFTTQGDVTIPEPPLAHTLFSTTRLAWLWAIIRIFLGYQWVTASLHKIEDPKWVSTGEALKGFWVSAVKIPDTGKPAISTRIARLNPKPRAIQRTSRRGPARRDRARGGISSSYQ